MVTRIALLASLTAVLVLAGCDGCADAPGDDDQGAATGCLLDADCAGGSVCLDGACSTALPIGPAGDDVPTDDGPVAGGAGTAQLSPQGVVDFGSPSIGVPVERRLLLTNTGSGPFDVTALANAAGTTAEFAASLQGGLPTTVSPGDAVEIVIVYTLADGDDDDGTILVATTAVACEPACADPTAIAVQLTSEFKGERNLLVAPVTHDFGFTAVGGDSAPVTLIVKNDGTLQKVLTVASLVAAGDVAEFEYTLPQLPLYLAPGETVGVPVLHHPTSMRDATITFTARANSDSPDLQALTSTMHATSLPPQALTFDPPALVFSTMAIGGEEQRTSSLKNLGGVPVTVTALDLMSASNEYDVFAALTTPFTIQVGGSTVVYATYRATTGAASATTAQAQNNQANGQVPVLALRGESFVPPGGPNVQLTTGPEDNALTDSCACQATGNVPAGNVDLVYRALPSGPQCSKPLNPSCGVGGTCPCDMGAYGDATWGSARTEEVRGETWIVDEQVTHDEPGQDASFSVKVNLLDDCLAVPGSTSYSANYGCCFAVDCDTAGGNNPAQACYPYGSYPHCATACEYFASQATSQDCLQRGPVTTRTRVRIYGGAGADEIHEFCTTLPASGASKSVVTLQRANGYFTIASIDPSAVEVAVGQACP